MVPSKSSLCGCELSASGTKEHIRLHQKIERREFFEVVLHDRSGHGS
jgi:hypothetical protein